MFENRIENAKYNDSSKSKLNVQTSSRRLKPDSCQTRRHKVDRPTPDSRQTQNLLDPTIRTTIASFEFLPAIVATFKTYFQFFLIA
jgi:hypothetical protein